MPQQPSNTASELPFIELQSVDSTNNYAFGRIHAGLTLGNEVIFAHEQVAGKGQRGKKWSSEKNSNITLSIILKAPPLLLTEQFQLSACAAVAAYDFYSNYAGEDTKIKWPNDIFWQDRKAGGILIESVVSSQSSVKKSSVAEDDNLLVATQWQWAIVGIGININQTHFPEEIRNPVSLKQITGKNFDTLVLAKELVICFQKRWDQLTNNGFQNILSDYRDMLYKKGSVVKFKKDSRVFEALVKTVLPTGQLVAAHGIEEIFDFGEVEWLIK